MTLDRRAWLRVRADRLALAATALRDPSAARRLLGAWRWTASPHLLEEAVQLDPRDTPDLARLSGWLAAPAGDLTRAHETEWDKDALEAAERADGDRRVAALYLLARLGEEHAERERLAWEEERFAEDPEDEVVADLWRRWLAGDLSPRARALGRRVLGPHVRASFGALCRGLGLPPEPTADVMARATEATDLVLLGAHLELAARLLETTGEPIGALAAALPDTAWPDLRACAGRRAAWRPALHWPPDAQGLSVGAEWAVARRLLDHLSLGHAPFTGEALPLWPVVRANRSRMRGRLRAVIAARPDLLSVRIPTLPALAGRTRAAARRWAWAWAWREARLGFPLDVDGLASPPCVPTAPDDLPLDPIAPAELPALRAWLLTMLGRGVWPELERWLSGAPGRDLDPQFYRYLALAPPALADPDAGRHTWLRLRLHLQDGGLDEHVPWMRARARDLAALDLGRGLRERVHATLAPDWCPAVPLPDHHLTPFVERCAAFLTGTG